MQTVVERVMRAFTVKHPLSDKDAKVVRQEITEFAAELLDKYKAQLAKRARPPHGH